MGNLLKLGYQLNRFYWNGWPLDRWLALLLALAGVLMLWGWLPGGRAGAASLGLIVLGRLVLQAWSRRRGYVVFVPQPAAVQEAPRPLPGLTSIPVRATGRFEVQSESRYFVELEAEFQSFEIREHAILGRLRAQRFLWFGKPPANDIGMWYIFFKPQALRTIKGGVLHHGTGSRPALQVEFEVEKPAEKRASLLSERAPRVYNETVYLSFESESDRRRVWLNLSYDAPAAAGT